MADRPIKVSVGIPVFNAEKYMERSARSLFGQTLSEMELVFIDDASSDRSMEILDRVLAEFPDRRAQVRVIRFPRNQGPMTARLTALEHFSGEYFIFCDADDFVEPDLYETMYRLAAEGREKPADVVHSGFHVIHVDGKKKRDSDAVDITDLRELLRQLNNGTLLPSLWCHMFRRDRIDAKQIFQPQSLRFSEDYLMLIQMLNQCSSLVCLPRGGYWYCRNTGSLCHQHVEENMRSARFVLRYLDRKEKDPVQTEARKSRWRALVHQALREDALSPRRAAAILRRCGPGVLGDRNLKWKKRIRLFLISRIPAAALMFQKKRSK